MRHKKRKPRSQTTYEAKTKINVNGNIHYLFNFANNLSVGICSRCGIPLTSANFNSPARIADLERLHIPKLCSDCECSMIIAGAT